MIIFYFPSLGRAFNGRESDRTLAIRFESWCILEQRGRGLGKFEQAFISGAVRLQRRSRHSVNRHRLYQGLLSASKVREHQELG